jgi:hypothetical protein
MICEDVAISEDAVDPVLLPAIGAMLMKEGRVGVSIFERGKAGALPGDGAVEGGEAKVGDPEVLVQPSLQGR